jgi:hypothetical protein
MKINQVLTLMNPVIFPKNKLKTQITNAGELQRVFASSRNLLNIQHPTTRHVYFRNPEYPPYISEETNRVFQQWLRDQDIESSYYWLYAHSNRFVALRRQQLDPDEIHTWRNCVIHCLYYQGVCEVQDHYNAHYETAAEIINFIKHSPKIPSNIPKKYGYIRKPLQVNELIK